MNIYKDFHKFLFAHGLDNFENEDIKIEKNSENSLYVTFKKEESRHFIVSAIETVASTGISQRRLIEIQNSICIDLLKTGKSYKLWDQIYIYVWLNTETWAFSNSWEEGYIPDDILLSLIDGSNKKVNENNKPVWKLIKYQCVNDIDFEFMNKMKIK